MFLQSFDDVWLQEVKKIIKERFSSQPTSLGRIDDVGTEAIPRALKVHFTNNKMEDSITEFKQCDGLLFTGV